MRKFAEGCGGPDEAFVKKLVITFGGAGLIKGYDLYGYRRGVHEKVCYHLWWGRSFTRFE